MEAVGLSIIEVNDLSFCSRTVCEGQSVCRISFEVDKGEIFAITGTRESGKNTVSRHLNGLLLPESGKVTVCGMDTSDSKNQESIRKKCGMVFSAHHRCFLASTVKAEIALALLCAGMDAKDIPEKCSAYLERTGMTDKEHARTETLTEYESLCVQISAVLASEPEVLIFEDAASGIYGKERESYFELLHKLHDGGKTIVIITNSFDEAAAAQRVLLLKEGSVLACGEARSILSDAELLEKAGIEPAFPMRVYHDLLDSDIKLSRPPLTMRELVDEICL